MKNTLEKIDSKLDEVEDQIVIWKMRQEEIANQNNKKKNNFKKREEIFETVRGRVGETGEQDQKNNVSKLVF